MHSVLRIIVLVSLGVAAGAAFAGPNWDAINSARAAAKHSAAASGTASSKEAMQKQCAEMMKSTDARPADGGSTKGSSEAK
ncbi:hypothetical protein [Ralstonia sp. SET104]|uniref:hypothetical protein n=1 Tax=Ralstonia sp. SET104 TaxID=2448774 RepID=UPI001623F36C|nr:hypothetical protein [Ralstonia sp. SET104]